MASLAECSPPIGSGIPEHALPPLVHPWIKRLLDQRADELFTLVQLHGSPLNIVFPQIAGENVRAIHEAIRPYRLDYEVLFGVKATKSDALLEGHPFARPPAMLEEGVQNQLSDEAHMRAAPPEGRVHGAA